VRRGKEGGWVGGREGGRFQSLSIDSCTFNYCHCRYYLRNCNRVAKGKDEPSAMIAVGGGCGCGEEVIHVAAAVGENGGAKGGADDPASSNNKV